MSGENLLMFVLPRPGRFDRLSYWTPLPTLAYTAVADTPEPLAAEPGRPVTESDGDDTDTVGHE